MPSPSPDARRIGAAHHLALLSQPQRGAAGERMASGTGSSLEFQDRRAYQAGDDVRHLDWRAFARSDQLLVRQYREEVLPRVEIVLDTSRSMAVEEAKAQLAVDVAAILALAGRGAGFQVAVALAGDAGEVVDASRFEELGSTFEARSAWPPALESALGGLRAGSMRVLVSDFLFPHSAAELVRPIAARGRGLALVQVLGGEDVEPPPGAALRLIDSESGSARDLVLDRRAVERYRERLRRLSGGLEEECRRAGARFVAVTARIETAALARELARAGLIDPA